MNIPTGASQSPLIAVPTAPAMDAPSEIVNPSGPHPDLLHHLRQSQLQSTLAQQPPLIDQPPQPVFPSPHVLTYVSSQTTLPKGTALLHPSVVSQFRA